MHPHHRTARTTTLAQRLRAHWPSLLASAALLARAPAAAMASSFTVIHAFCTKTGCRDGSTPMSPLLLDAAGNLYGTTQTGGRHNAGTVYRLSPSAGGKWIHSVLYSFCAKPDCSDGRLPSIGALIVDENGNLYGTASASNQRGTAFRLSPGADPGARWTLTTLHEFCSSGGRCLDGDTPSGGLTYSGLWSGAPYNGRSTLFGLTKAGGQNGKGTAYMLRRDSTGWREKVIWHFCPDTNCHEGGNAGGSMVLVAGLLYGVGAAEGQYRGGTLYSMLTGRHAGDAEAEHVFCNQTNCADGKEPSFGTLEVDSQSNVYGTTILGGANGKGVAYKVNVPSQRVTVLYSFCHRSGCADGKLANGGLLMKDEQTFYGTLTGGGNSSDAYAQGAGLVYKLSGGSIQFLHKFCSSANCTDGSQPLTGVISDKSGALYGTASAGGSSGHGVVYRITP